jgi:hypothetical protein
MVGARPKRDFRRLFSLRWGDHKNGHDYRAIQQSRRAIRSNGIA